MLQIDIGNEAFIKQITTFAPQLQVLMLNTENIQSLIDSGEGYNVEFKVRVPSKVRELTEEICAFANTDGGYLLIGIEDNRQIIGTSLENNKRSAIQVSISEISPVLHCKLYTVNIEDKTVWVIDVSSGKDKPYIFSGAIFINALSHRDYYEQGATIIVEMFNDQVEVSNPEGLLPLVAKDFGHKSMTHNPLVFGLFTRMHLVKRVASDIPRMQKAMKEADLPEPEFHTEGMFTVVFKRKYSIISDTVNSREKEVLRIIQKYPGLNSYH